MKSYELYQIKEKSFNTIVSNAIEDNPIYFIDKVLDFFTLIDCKLDTYIGLLNKLGTSTQYQAFMLKTLFNAFKTKDKSSIEVLLDGISLESIRSAYGENNFNIESIGNNSGLDDFVYWVFKEFKVTDIQKIFAMVLLETPTEAIQELI